MDRPSSSFEPGPGTPSRRRLTVAIGAMLVLGVIAATVAHEHASPPPASEAPSVVTIPVVPEVSPDVIPPIGTRPDDRADPQAAAVERLRVHVDRYLDARAHALRELDVARRAGVDEAVLSAMGHVLGMPIPRPAAPPEGSSDDGTGTDDEARSL